MKITHKKIGKTLNQKILQLNDIIADIDHLLTEMETNFYRVSIFGSARIKAGTPNYEQVYELAYQLAKRGVDIVTGGGPGLMGAANKGAKDGGKESRSIGLPISLPFESRENAHLDVKRHHRRFSSRLDEFMRISHAVIVTPGGIGTLLEMFYTWQLIQVGHIKTRPILLLGDSKMWKDLIAWFEKWPVKNSLMTAKDVDNLTICDSIEKVISHLEPEFKKFQQKHPQ